MEDAFTVEGDDCDGGSLHTDLRVSLRVDFVTVFGIVSTGLGLIAH